MRPALEKFIESKGQVALAREMGLSQGATQAWACGRARPSPDRAAELFVLSKGKLSFEAIYAPEIKAAAERMKLMKAAKKKAN